MILIDTSVWIEYFKKTNFKRSQFHILDQLLYDNRVVTCFPIYSEVLSGQMSTHVFKIIENAFQAMTFIDPDWTQEKTWKKLSELAQKAYKQSVPACGLVDRMILYCSINHEIPLWTIDRKLELLANFYSVQIFKAK